MNNNVVDFTINLNGNAVSGSVELKDTIQQLRESVDRAVKSFAQFGELASGLDVVTGTVEKVTQSFGKMVDLSMNFERQYGNLKSDMDQSAKASRDAASAMDDYAEKCDDAAEENKDLSNSINRTNEELVNSATSASTALSRIGKSALDFDVISNVIGKVSQAFSSLVGTSLEFEQQQANLKTLLNGDAEATDNLVGKIREYASATVYDRSGLVEAQKTMMAFGLDAEYAFGKLKNIGDIALGDKQKMQSLALAFSQMSSTGKLMGQDLLQMINAGFNPLEVISQKTGKSIAELKDEMVKGAISAEQVAQAFEWATQEGGRFYQGAEQAAETTAGKIAKVKDKIDNFKVSLFEWSHGATAYIAELGNMVVPLAQVLPLFTGLHSVIKKVKALDFAGMMTKWRHSVNGARISLAFMRKDIATCNMASLGFIGNTVRATMAVGRFATVGLFNALKGIGAYILSLVTGGAASKTFANVATASFAQFALSAKAACKAVSVAIMNIPIVGWIAAAISAVVGLGVLLWNRSEKFRQILFGVWESVKAVANNVWQVIKTVAEVVYSVVHYVIEKVVSAIRTVRDWVVNVFVGVGNFFKSIWISITGMIHRMVNGTVQMLSKVGNWSRTKLVEPIKGAFQNMWTIVRYIFDKILNKLGKLFAPVRELWNKLFPNDKMKDVSMAYSTGAKKGSASWKKSQEKKNGDIDTSKSTEVLGIETGTQTGSGTGTGTPKGLKEGEMGKTAGVTAGKAQQITIRLENMVGTMNFNGSLQEKASDVEARLTEMMARILGMAETAM